MVHLLIGPFGIPEKRPQNSNLKIFIEVNYKNASLVIKARDVPRVFVEFKGKSELLKKKSTN
jgi:hypothetical protein